MDVPVADRYAPVVVTLIWGMTGHIIIASVLGLTVSPHFGVAYLSHSTMFWGGYCLGLTATLRRS